MPSSVKKSEASDLKTPTRQAANSSANSSNSTPTTSVRRPTRKRRRLDKDNGAQDRRKSVDSDLDECNMDDVLEIDRRLRKVARLNSISTEDMHKVVRSVVRNEHVLALVTLKAEDELAREKREAEAKEELQQQRGAIIITETPSVAKLTRAKARELNRTPGITLPPLNDTSEKNEIEALIREDLHSDEEDEEYTFKEDDFHSDDDPNTTASDFDSNPCTPQTPLTVDESPVKLTSDGCFKVPPDKITDDPRIATRTRSKFCLQQTTIEDLQSEFVPPDLEDPGEVLEQDISVIDADWMQFLNDFSKPLNNTFHGDDDDLINDPEYVAAEKVPVDAEELRDVNISKKELTDLVSELLAGLFQEGTSVEAIELDTPQKFLTNEDPLVPENPMPLNSLDQVTRQIDFDAQPPMPAHMVSADVSDLSLATNPGMDVFQPNIMSTPCTVPTMVAVPVAETALNGAHMDSNMTIVNISSEAIAQQPPEMIAVPLPGQPNYFQLAKVTEPPYYSYMHHGISTTTQTSKSLSNLEPYDTNFACKYLSVQKHIHSEYEEYFENLRNVKPTPASAAPAGLKGFTTEQHDMLQQQLRIHTQILTQTFVQTYSHPSLFSLARKPKELLQELHQRAQKDASFNCTNLNDAVVLIKQWEHDLCSDENDEENRAMMRFINKETDLTDGNTRQVPRLPPRIMDLMLDSKVFMYPQYLPRMAFQPRKKQVSLYAPSEYQLIAMGLEKHLPIILKAKKLRKTCDPIRIACKRMAKDTLHGKEYRRILFKINELRSTDLYNPIKYFFDHKRAPPISQYLWGFEDGVVRTPREQVDLLPSGWKLYIQKKWNNDKRERRSSKIAEPAKASAQARESFLEFVREAVGEDLVLPDSLGEASHPDASATTHLSQPADTEKSKPQRKVKQRRRCVARDYNSSLTINVNYVFGGLNPNPGGAGVSVPLLPVPYVQNVANINQTLQKSSECSQLALPPPVPQLDDDAPPPVNFTFNAVTQSVEFGEISKAEDHSPHTPSDSFGKSVEQTKEKSPSALGIGKGARCQIFKRQIYNQLKHRGLKPKSKAAPKTTSRSRYHVLRDRLHRKLRARCTSLISSYGSYLEQQRHIYAKSEAVQYYHRRFLALELYTQLLVELRMFCESKNDVGASANATPPQQEQQKRQRTEDAVRNRRANRQEEMLRQMLHPDTPDDRNRKDATFAFNFYEKVEEALLSANRLEDCQKFNQLLQSFDPNKDKVSDLYLKVENLLLPEFPELAEVFLNFLLPAEASELGKYFEYFMITNASNFINKLNIYFSKQPAQIRKIYACLSELAEMPSVSMKKVESKILPLLKGNQFLCDWFLQQFPQAKPPKRLLPPAESVSLHEVMNNTSGEFAETVHELIEDSPVQDKPPGCQIRYQNGHIYYGSKIMLPAKLSFRAASIYNEQSADAASGESLICAHGVRVHGEKLINAAASADSDDGAERSEEDDPSRALVIDTTTGDEDNSCSSIDMCDEVTLRAHAIRLNASYYSNSFHSASTSTPNVSNSHHATHHPNAKRTAINFGDVSPRRHSNANLSPLSGVSPMPAANTCSPQPDKRKSPSKKVRSPLGSSASRPRFNMQPMVVIHEPQVRPATVSPAIECAKRLRTLIDQESGPPDELDNKAGIRIIAQAKQNVTPPETIRIAKQELEIHEHDMDTDDVLREAHYPIVKMDVEHSSDGLEMIDSSVDFSGPQHVITTQFDSDEDCKLDVVASLANIEQDQVSDREVITQPATPSGTSSAWTREEDKVILIEMKMGARDRQHLIKRIGAKMRHRNEDELRARHQFLMDFLSKLQGK